jgi:hypothetical protein
LLTIRLSVGFMDERSIKLLLKIQLFQHLVPQLLFFFIQFAFTGRLEDNLGTIVESFDQKNGCTKDFSSLQGRF